MTTKNVVFIDSRVAGYETLIASLGADTEWYLLDTDQDGVDQMQRILAGYSELDSIQVISHGSTGALYLGSTMLNSDNLASYQTQLQAIGASLTETGDILLYGCNVAQGDIGVGFVNSLAQITGADVAASDDMTGSAAPGRDAVLEVATGGVGATALDLSSVAGSLAVIAGTDSNDNLTGTASNDTISGGAGDDNINGGDGVDVAIYSGTMSGYLIEVVNGQLTIRDGYALNGNDGTDKLANIEVIRFADGELTAPAPPSGPFAEFAVNAITTGNQWWPVAEALDDGGFTITWQSRWPNDSFDPELYPYGTYSRTYDAQGIAVAGDVRIGDYLGDSIFPGANSASTNLTGGGQVVLSEKPDGMNNGIVAQLFDPRGEAIGAELQVNQTIRFNQTAPVVLATPDGGFLAAWHAYGQDGSGYGIFMRRFDAVGAPISEEIQVNDSNYATQSNPSLAVLGNGDYLIAWQSGQTPESVIGYDIRAHRFTANLTPRSVEVVGTDGANKMYGGAGTVVLRGGGGNDILKGGADRDVLYGDSGADTLNGESGNDHMFGGADNDIYYIESAGDRVFETLTSAAADLSDTGGDDTVYSTIDFDLNGYNGVRYVENLTLTGSIHLKGAGNSLANRLVGNAGNNILSGHEGNDSLSGMDGFDKLNGDGGNDVLDGGAGVDTLYGYSGNDTYVVNLTAAGALEDVVSESSGSGIDTIQLAGTSINVTAVKLTLGSGLENLNAYYTGTSLLNLTGNTKANVLKGNAANNILTGGTGADTLYGYAGDDTYIVNLTAAGALEDVVSESSGSGIDTIQLAGTSINVTAVKLTLATGLENLNAYYTGSSLLNLTGNTDANVLKGNAANNILTGSSGNDTLYGYDGNDTLIGGTGKDLLVGGNGNDIFDFNALSEMGTTSSTWDVISGFESGQDRIDLRTLDADTMTTTTNDAFSGLTVGGTFSGSFASAGELYFDTVAKVLYGNTNADGAADFAIQITGVTTLTTADLLM